MIIDVLLTPPERQEVKIFNLQTFSGAIFSQWLHPLHLKSLISSVSPMGVVKHKPFFSHCFSLSFSG